MTGDKDNIYDFHCFIVLQSNQVAALNWCCGSLLHFFKQWLDSVVAKYCQTPILHMFIKDNFDVVGGNSFVVSYNTKEPVVTDTFMTPVICQVYQKWCIWF